MDDLEDMIRLSYFSETAKAIVSETSLNGIMDRLMEKIGESFAPVNWSLLLLDRKSEQLVFRVAVGKAGDKLVGVRIPAYEGIAGWVVTHGHELIVEDVSTDSRFSERMDAMTGFRTESIVAVPLRSGNKVFGVIELINKCDGGSFSALEMRVLATIADFAAIAIEKAVYLNQLRRMAMYDALTGLLNRRGLSQVLDRERARLKRYGGSMVFLLADIDEFKAINDARGHAAGDVVLKTAARALAAACRESDAVARYGGDEFLVAMPNAGPGEAERARERFGKALAAAAETCPAGSFTVSIGVYGGDGRDMGLIFRETDKDLYRRKEERGAASFGDRVLEIMDEEKRPADDADGVEAY